MTPSVAGHARRRPCAAEDLAAQEGARQDVPAGSKVKYQLIVKSTGGTAHGVVVCDKLPDHMTYVALGNATMENGKACWTIGDLTGSMTLSLSAKVDADAPAGTLTNNATATSSNAGKAKAHGHGQRAGQARRQGQAQAHGRRDRIASRTR